MQNQFISLDEFKVSLETWMNPLQKITETQLFVGIYKFIKSEVEGGKKVLPPQNKIFAAFQLTPIFKIKAVIIGQDPYFQPNQANGLAFSISKPLTPPPSLKNIYKNLQTDSKIQFQKPQHGDLTKWAQQGVFLLNSYLTVEQNKPMSHSKCGWKQFTDEVIRVIDAECEGVVFFLWGKFAQEKAKLVNTNKHKILCTSHPSPLSAHNGFHESRFFSECNEYLQKIGKTPIDWSLDP